MQAQEPLLDGLSISLGKRNRAIGRRLHITQEGFEETLNQSSNHLRS